MIFLCKQLGKFYILPNLKKKQEYHLKCPFFRKIWDAVKGEEVTTFSHKHIVKTVDFSHDDAKLLTGSNEKKMRIFDLGKPEAGI